MMHSAQVELASYRTTPAACDRLRDGWMRPEGREHACVHSRSSSSVSPLSSLPNTRAVTPSASSGNGITAAAAASPCCC